MEMLRSTFCTKRFDQPACEDTSVDDSEVVMSRKPKRHKEARLDRIKTGAGEQGGSRGGGEESPQEQDSEMEKRKTSDTAKVVGTIEDRCTEFINEIERLTSDLDQRTCEACRAILLEILSSTKALPRALKVASFEGKEKETQLRKAAERELQQVLLDCAQAVEDLNTSLERRKREKDARERAEQEVERVEQELQQARSECAKAVEDLNKTRAELAAAFPGGGDIAGTFPIASELRNAYRELCSQDLFNLSPEDLPSTVALFKEIFRATSSHSNCRFNESCSDAKTLLCLCDDDEEEWKPVEGLIQKAMRLRRSAMFKIDGLEEGLNQAISDPQSAFCAVLRTNPGARPALLKSIQSLAYLMGCFYLFQPVLRVNPGNIGKEVEYSSNLHQVLDGRCKAGDRCTIIFPALFQNEEHFCKALVSPSLT